MSAIERRTAKQLGAIAGVMGLSVADNPFNMRNQYDEWTAWVHMFTKVREDMSNCPEVDTKHLNKITENCNVVHSRDKTFKVYNCGVLDEEDFEDHLLPVLRLDNPGLPVVVGKGDDKLEAARRVRYDLERAGIHDRTIEDLSNQIYGGYNETVHDLCCEGRVSRVGCPNYWYFVVFVAA